MKKLAAALAATGAICLVSTSSSAASITSFSDNFNAESQALNKTVFANWNVISGSVDVIGCGANGNCVDLDGSSNAAGTLQTKDSFLAGTYDLSFALAGSAGTNNDTVTVTLGNYSQQISLAAGTPFQTFNVTAVVLALTQLTFAHSGGDNVGMLLDNVSVGLSSSIPPSPVPLPGALALMGSVVGGGAFVMRRRRKQVA